MEHIYRAKTKNGRWIEGSLMSFEVIPGTVGQYTGKKDIHGNKIFYNIDVFKFKFKEDDNWTELTGSFDFDEEDLRAEIDVKIERSRHKYLCLSYNSANMKDFEIIGNRVDNPELMEAE